MRYQIVFNKKADNQLRKNDEIKILIIKGYRKLIIDNYILFYLVDEENKQVTIMRVLYGKQKYENLL